jgi:hypothetical protein
MNGMNTKFELRKADCENTNKQIRASADQWADHQVTRVSGEDIVVWLSDILHKA